MSKEQTLSASKRKEKCQQFPNPPSNRHQSQSEIGNSIVSTPVVSGKTGWLSNCAINIIDPVYGKQYDKLEDVRNADTINKIDVSQLTENITKMIFQSDSNYCFSTKRINESQKTDDTTAENSSSKGKKSLNILDETQTQQIKKVLVDCLQNIDRNLDERTKEKQDVKFFCRKSFGKMDKYTNKNIDNVLCTEVPLSSTLETTKASLLRSYLSGSNPAREEYISKRRNVSNSLISSDSVHHSILLESSREKRQCLLQYLSNVVGDGQVVIYVNSIPGVEALMSFLKKHGFHVNAVHPRILLAESNWILSEFSLKKFSVLLCAEDHYHSCPAHFRWVKTIINYELPISNPTENWSIRNGIVEFSDNLPVHIYTFIKKSCPLDHELVKLLRLDSQEDQEPLPVL